MAEHRFEGEIRHAFERYEMSAEATLPVARGAATRSSQRSRWIPRLTVPIVAAAVALAVVTVTLSPATPAFASWKAEPASADPSIVASARAACDSVDDDHLAGLSLVASEQRGDYTMLLFGSGATYGLCLTGPDIEPTILAGPGSGAVDVPGAPTEPAPAGHPGDGGALAPGIQWIAQPGGGGSEPLAGRVQAWFIGISPDTSRVTIERTTGEPTIATVADGVAFAWWPAGSEAVAITAYDAAGNVLLRVPVAGFGEH
ncbi:MAG: hypothetical protein H0U52_11090 [Chloroflexi bacterium]|nr:hypothetical protein [Chloroflexota bacterium]